MRRHFSQAFFALAAIAASPVGACANRAVTPGSVSTVPADIELDRIRNSVDKALTAPPPGGYAAIPAGVRLLSISRGPNQSIVMNFSDELVSAGTGRVLEDALHQILMAASTVRPQTVDRIDDYRVLIKGVPLETYLP